MSCPSCQKKTERSQEEKKKIISRMNRIIGQMSGIKKMIEEDRYCDEVLIQLSAIDKAIRSLSSLMLETHMHRCLIDQIQNGDFTGVDEVIDLFRRFQ